MIFLLLILLDTFINKTHPPEICDSAIAAFFADFAHFRRFYPLSQIAENFADFALF